MSEASVSNTQENANYADELFQNMCAACDRESYCNKTDTDHGKFWDANNDTQALDIALQHFGEEGEIQFGANGEVMWVPPSPPETSEDTFPKDEIKEHDSNKEIAMSTNETQSSTTEEESEQQPHFPELADYMFILKEKIGGAETK